jgi:hypothetical protein
VLPCVIGHDLHLNVAGPGTYFSMNTLPSPKAFCAFADRALQAFLQLALLLDDAHALPPPPAAALIRIGKVMVLGHLHRFLHPLTAPSVPGTSGTPNFFTASLAASLSPITSMACGEGR